MYILGIHHKHDASACLIKNGKLVAMAEEERFSRNKHHAGFPFRAVEFVLREGKIRMEEVDYVALGIANPAIGHKLFVKHYLLNGTFLMDGAGGIRNILHQVNGKYNRAIFDSLRKIAPAMKKEQIGFVEHHLSHAASAFRFSGFDNSSVITFDGWGDFTTTTQGFGKGNQLEITNRTWGTNSLGFLYGALTQYLGYPKGFGHEGKVMGLAAYGKPTCDLSEIIQLTSKGFVVNKKFAYGKNTLSRIEKKFGPSWKDSYSPFSKFHANLASTLQKKLEEAALQLVRETIQTTGLKKVCLAGGVALNCKMNGEIAQDSLVQELFVQPAAGDEGKPLGAAMQLYAELGHKAKEEMEHAYWGPEFSSEYIEKMLKEHKIMFEKADDIEGTAAGLIAKGNIVGWFQGRMEVGPRALGNRSLLADPTNPKMKEIMNKKVKDRETWRPFAPSVLEKSASEYFEGCKKAPFMIVAYPTVEKKKKEIPAVVHVDGTARPQTVSKKTNPRYYKLIHSFETISGHPVVLNTSFNEKEPIVCTPMDAYKTFMKTGTDYLVLGNYLIKK